MKRLVAAAILAVIVTGVYLCGYFLIKNTYIDANNMLKECINAYDSSDNANKKAKALEEFWSKKEKILSVCANHSEIDDIEMAIHLLTVYSRTDEKEIFKEYSGTVKMLLHQMKEDTVPNMHSIF